MLRNSKIINLYVHLNDQWVLKFQLKISSFNFNF